MTERRTRRAASRSSSSWSRWPILALISIYLTGMLTQQNRAYTVVDQVTEAQSNTRAISQILEREVRMSGSLVPEGGAACGVDNTGAPDILYVTDNEPLQIMDTMNYELGAQILAASTARPQTRSVSTRRSAASSSTATRSSTRTATASPTPTSVRAAR